MKKISYILIFIVVALGFIAPLFMVMLGSASSFFGSSQYLPEKDDGYTIESYDINIIINQDKTMHITEKITANFLTESHGIVRYLPINQKVRFYDNNGKLVSKNYRNKISNFTYNSTSSTAGTRLVSSEETNGYMFYYLGSNVYVTGERTYSFSYVFDIGDDRVSSKDLFYFNIIGTGWDTTISNLTFKVIFPTSIDAQSEDFKFYVGQYGENTSSNGRVPFSVSGNTISGSCSFLDYGEAVTVYKEFEDGYFKIKKSVFFDVVLLIATLIVMTLAIIYFVKKRRKDPIVEVVEFSPPNGMTPTEAGYINDGKITGDDISALVVYWASKGYVSLTEKGKNVEITKIKDLPDSAKEHEKIFFKALFNDAISENGAQPSVNSGDLSKLSPDAVSRCKKSVEKNCDICFDKKINAGFNWLVIGVALLYIVFVWKEYIESCLFGWQLVTAFLMFAILFIVVGTIPAISKKKDKLNKKKFWLLWSLFAILILFSHIVLCLLVDGYNDVCGARFYLILLPLFLLVTYQFLERYTEVGKVFLGKIRGLKNYIMVAEKDKMEMLVKEDPSLFYAVLPYAYVLGVSDVYMTKFEDVTIAQPEWYSCDNFTSAYFTVRMIDNLNLMSITMRNNLINSSVGKVSSTISNFGGGSGGGGFSGGGSGGGGGGRW